MNVRDWFDNLSERERRLVYAAGALVGVALVYLVLVLPFQTSGKRMAARVGEVVGVGAEVAHHLVEAVHAQPAEVVAQRAQVAPRIRRRTSPGCRRRRHKPW